VQEDLDGFCLTSPSLPDARRMMACPRLRLDRSVHWVRTKRGQELRLDLTVQLPHDGVARWDPIQPIG
jgi:hypothetical protein